MKVRTLRVLLALMLTASTSVWAASWPDWARDADSPSLLERYGEEQAVVLLDQWELKLQGGRRQGTRRRLVAVLTEEGRDEAVFGLVLGAFSRYEKIRVWVRQPDGRVKRYSEEDGTLFSVSDEKTLDDTHVLAIAPPGAGPGAQVALETRVIREADYPQDLFVIQESIPVVRSEISVDARRDWNVESRMYLGDNPLPDPTHDEGVWRFNDVRPVKVESGVLAPAPPRMSLALSYAPPGGKAPFLDWIDTTAWVGRLFEQDEADAEAVAATVETLRASGVDPVEAAGRFARRQRYFAIELGWGGYRPRPPATTLRRGFGDCKDKVQLMVALLRALGVEADPVLLMAPSDRYVPDEMPSPFHFNHAVVAIAWSDRPIVPGMCVVDSPELGPLRIYDPTLSDRSAQDISPAHYGGAALVVHPRTVGLLRLPGSDPEENRVESDELWTLDADGGLSVDHTLGVKGAMRTFLEGEGGEWIRPEKLRERVYASIGRMAHIPRDLTIRPVEEREDGTWSYRANYRATEVMGRFGGVQSLWLGPLVDRAQVPLPKPGEDAETLYLPVPGGFRQRLVISIAPFRLEALPAEIDVANELGRVHQSARIDGGQVIVERELMLKTSRVPPERRPEARQLRSALTLVNDAALLLR